MKKTQEAVVFRLKGIAMLLLLASISTSQAEDPKAKPQTPNTGRSTLSAAADAASAAAVAAKAAADAASAAAQAASAAIQAINTLLPAPQRALSPQPSPPSLDLPIKKLAPISSETNNSNALSAKEENRDLRIKELGNAPIEQSLFGLIGTYEIGLDIDKSGDFIRSLNRVTENSTSAIEISAISLDETLNRTLGFSREVLIAQYRQEQASAQAGQARAELLPSLSLFSKTGKETSSPSLRTDPITGLNLSTSSHNRSDKTITLTQPLFNLSSFYNWRRFKLIEKARVQNKLVSKGDAYLAAVNGYLNLTSTKIQTDLTAEYENQIMELYQYIETRSKAGAANPSDVDRVRARVININATKVEQNSAHSAAGIEFIRLVNVMPKSMRLPQPEELGIESLPSSFEKASELIFANNSDIQALKEELAASNADISSAKGRYLPRLNLEFSKNEVAHAGGAPGVQKDERAMLVMNWTPFNSGGDVNFHKEKIARRSELIYRLDDQNRRVLQNLSAQYATLEAVRVRIKKGYEELESVSSAARSMSARMLSANQSLLDLLDVYERNHQAKMRLVVLHIQELNTISQITRLLENDVSQVKPKSTTFNAEPSKSIQSQPQAIEKSAEIPKAIPEPIQDKLPIIDMPIEIPKIVPEPVQNVQQTVDTPIETPQNTSIPTQNQSQPINLHEINIDNNEVFISTKKNKTNKEISVKEAQISASKNPAETTANEPHTIDLPQNAIDIDAGFIDTQNNNTATPETQLEP